MPIYKVAKYSRRIVRREYLVTADTEKDAVTIVEGGGGIHLPEWDSEEPEDISCEVIQEMEDIRM